MNTPITYRFLDQWAQEAILTAFNQSFSDYSVPLQLSTEQWSLKLKNDRISLSDSIGAFDGDQLVGLILHGKDGTALYNAGTGVIPSHRGQQITRKMYEFAIPVFKTLQYTGCVLEVISNNEAAKQSYQKIGFEKTADLNCYRGTLSPITVPLDLELKEMTRTEYINCFALVETQPTWQNNHQAVLENWNIIEVKSICLEQKLIGFIAYHPTTYKILQLFIKTPYRRKGYARLVLQSIFNTAPKVLITNVSADASELNSLFLNLELELFLKQDQMIMRF